jgi:hypothetical protein
VHICSRTYTIYCLDFNDGNSQRRYRVQNRSPRKTSQEKEVHGLGQLQVQREADAELKFLAVPPMYVTNVVL